MNKSILAVAALAAVFGLSACGGPSEHDKERAHSTGLLSGDYKVHVLRKSGPKDCTVSKIPGLRAVLSCD